VSGPYAPQGTPIGELKSHQLCLTLQARRHHTGVSVTLDLSSPAVIRSNPVPREPDQLYTCAVHFHTSHV
jgi:hypothetical protein